MNQNKHGTFWLLIGAFIGLLGIGIGVALDVDARSMQYQITEIADNVKSYQADQMRQDAEITTMEITIQHIVDIESQLTDLFIGVPKPLSEGKNHGGH